MNYKKIFILFLMVFSISLIGCKQEEPNYDYRKKEKPNKEYESVIKRNVDGLKEEIIKIAESSNDGSSYWFVVWEVKGKSTKVNTFITQPHEGFSMKEFKEEHGDDIFLLNLVEVSYETYKLNE